MRNRKRKLIYLFASILSFLVLLLIFFFISPHQSWSLGFISLKATLLALIPLMIFSFSLPTYLLKSRKHGILCCIFIALFFIFRLSGLTHPLFAILLLALFLTFELLFTSKSA